MRRTLEYQPSLDGLRGVAVAGVVAFHLGHLQGGFLGVDLFFTLSGYLITRLLLLEHESTGRVARGAFWTRRAWRLLPALYLLLGSLAVYAALFARPDELAGIRGPGLASLLYVANWWLLRTGDGYWDIFAAPSPLEHMWSLAIEEQFYIVWPVLFVVVLGARRNIGRLLAVTVALAAMSAVLLGVLAAGDVSRAYFGSFTRSSSILVGAALAMVVHRGDRWLGAAVRSKVAPWLAAAAAGFLAWSWISIDGAVDLGWYRGGFLMHALAVAVIIAVLTHRPNGPATGILSWGPIRGLGIVSYGFYLWHWPVIVVLDGDRTGLDGGALLLVRLAVALAATLASYFLLERPARHVLAKRVSPLVVFPIAAVVLAVVLVAATVPPPVRPVIGAAPAPSPTAPPTTTVSAADTAADPTVAAAGDGPGSVPVVAPADPGPTDTGNTAAATTAPATTAPAEAEPEGLLRTIPTGLPTLRTPTADDPLRVLLVGDSYLYDAAPGMLAAMEADGVVAPIDRSRLGFTITDDRWEDTLTGFVADHRPELVIAMWARFDAKWLETNDPAEYQPRLDRAVEILTADGAVLAFVGLAPSLTEGVDPVPMERGINTFFEAIPARHPGRAFYVEPDPIVAPDGTPDRWIDTPAGPLLVRKVDGSHYCGDGSARFGLAVAEILAAVAGVAPADPALWWAADWRTERRYDDPPGACA